MVSGERDAKCTISNIDISGKGILVKLVKTMIQICMLIWQIKPLQAKKKIAGTITLVNDFFTVKNRGILEIDIKDESNISMGIMI